MRRVGFWFRVLALLIDLVIFLPLAIVPVYVLSGTREMQSLVLLSGWLVYSASEVFGVGTPGKRLFWLEIANTDGSRADRWKRSLRWSTKLFPIIINLMFLFTGYPLLYPLAGLNQWIVVIGCFFAASDTKQAWHDQWANTAVFRRLPVVQKGAFPVVPILPPPLPKAAGAEAEITRQRVGH